MHGKTTGANLRGGATETQLKPDWLLECHLPCQSPIQIILLANKIGPSVQIIAPHKPPPKILDSPLVLPKLKPNHYYSRESNTEAS